MAETAKLRLATGDTTARRATATAERCKNMATAIGGQREEGSGWWWWWWWVEVEIGDVLFNCKRLFKKEGFASGLI